MPCLIVVIIEGNGLAVGRLCHVLACGSGFNADDGILVITVVTTVWIERIHGEESVIPSTPAPVHVVFVFTGIVTIADEEVAFAV